MKLLHINNNPEAVPYRIRRAAETIMGFTELFAKDNNILNSAESFNKKKYKDMPKHFIKKIGISIFG